MDFGNDAAAYLVGPFTSVVALDRSYLCATVPEDNDSRPFLPAARRTRRVDAGYCDGSISLGRTASWKRWEASPPNSPLAAEPGAAG